MAHTNVVGGSPAKRVGWHGLYWEGCLGGWDKSPEDGGEGGGISATIAGVITAVLFSALIAWLYFASASAQTSTIAGVASVIDGDTIEIHGGRIRLSGFDSPERGSMCGATNVYQRAALALSDFIGSRTVSCNVTERDRYNRAVATCSVGGDRSRRRWRSA